MLRDSLPGGTCCVARVLLVAAAAAVVFGWIIEMSISFYGGAKR